MISFRLPLIWFWIEQNQTWPGWAKLKGLLGSIPRSNRWWKMLKGAAWNNSTELHLISWFTSPLKRALLTIRNDFFFLGFMSTREGSNACFCMCQQAGESFWLFPEHPNPKGKQVFWFKGLKGYCIILTKHEEKKDKNLPLSLHTQTQSTHQENTVTNGVGVCQADGLRLNVFEVVIYIKVLQDSSCH